MCQSLTGMVGKVQYYRNHKFCGTFDLLTCLKLFRLRVSRNRKYCLVKAYPDKKYKNKILVLSTIF